MLVIEKYDAFRQGAELSACCLAAMINSKDDSGGVCSSCKYPTELVGDIAIDRINRLIESAARLGWNRSGEGWNGECPLVDEDGTVVQDQVATESVSKLRDEYDRCYS